MEDTVVPLAPRVTLPKVGTPLCPISDFTPDAGHIAAFVCVGALAILDRLDEVDYQTLSWWLAERQLANGGLNGRPEKKEDVSSTSILETSDFLDGAQVCYSFWVLSALSILNKLNWIDSEKLTEFILSAQVCPSGVTCTLWGELTHDHAGQ